MIDGLDEIRAAAESLAERDERLKARLKQAGAEFWSAMYHADDWSPELRQRAEEIQGAILANGTVTETVAKMSIEEARDVANKILHLFVTLEKANVEARRKTATDEPA